MPARRPTATASSSPTRRSRASSAALLLAALGALAAPGTARAACSLLTGPCIEMTVPASHAWGDLSPGTTTSPQQTVSVESTASWGLKVSSDRTDGRLAEWTGSAYVAGGRAFTNPMQWGLSALAGVAQTPTYSALSGTAATVVTGRAASSCTITACTVTTVGLTYRQPVSYSDRRISPNTYRMSVVYEARHGW